MSKKDYIAIAARFADLTIGTPAAGFDEGYVAGVQDAAEAFATVAEAANPRFDRERFLTACGF